MVDNVFSNLTGPRVAEQDSGWSVSDIERSAYVRVTYAIISLFGLTGNALVIFVLVRIPSLRNRTSQFIIHLAFTDFLTCVWIIVFNLFPGSPAMPPGFLGDLICRIFINKFPLWATIFASVYSLVSVHLERFVAVVYPFRYKRLFTPSKSALIMVGCWLVGVISNSYFWFVYENEDGMCSIQPYPHFIIKRLVGVYTFSVVYIIPITFNFVVHKKMISVLKDKAAILESKEVTLANLDKAFLYQTHLGRVHLEYFLRKVAQERTWARKPNYRTTDPLSTPVPFHRDCDCVIIVGCASPFPSKGNRYYT
ncbi:putative gastrin/cholecystokinin type B receptor-like [Apostichopus japonicus]|uniref:Putative gastrin/cholecystokinin type B receptor-like n=1 Tax=Stichopus japonicus TaxID=307972 RepID=A0A2G8L5R9_STIJA|nr:putative gastrin/cholecystokinin type B receptor-like [Apostichopus japonicus]